MCDSILCVLTPITLISTLYVNHEAQELASSQLLIVKTMSGVMSSNDRIVKIAKNYACDNLKIKFSIINSHP